MFNQQQLTACDQIDYDVPPSTCGYPIYFSICGQPDQTFNRHSNSSATLPRQHSQLANCNNIINNNNYTDIHRYKTLPHSVKGYDDINGNRNENVLIPDRDFNFNQLLRLSENQPKNISDCGQIYDVPQPHPRLTPLTPPANGQSDIRLDNVYPAQLVITTNNYDNPQFPPTPPPSSSSSSMDKGLIENQSLKQLPRSGSHDFSRSSLPRTICTNTSLPLPLTTIKPISNFGSTSSLPSPIPNHSSLETSTTSFSSSDNNNNNNNNNNAIRSNNSNRFSLSDQSMGGSSETYDVPPNRETGKPLTDMVNGCCSNCGTLTLPRGSLSGFQRKTSYNTLIDERNYDKSTSNNLIKNNQLTYDVPKNTLSRNNNYHDRCSSSSSQRPMKAITAIARSYSSNNNTNNNSLSSSSSSLSSNQLDNYIIDSFGLDLNLDGGLILANRLESESLEAIGKLIGISSTEGWRKRENLETKLSELTKLCSQLKCVIRELEVFTDGIYINSLKIQSTSSSINNKLHRLSRQLKDSANIVISTIRSIESRGWNLNELSIINTQNESRKVSHDELDQLIACMPGLKEDIKHIMSLVKSYGNLLFPIEKQVDKQQQQQQPTINKMNCCLSNTIGSVSSSTCKSTSGSVKSLPSKPPPPPVPPKPPINLRPLPLVPKDNLSYSSSETTDKMKDLNLGKVTLESGTTTTKEEDYQKLGNQIKDEDADENDDYASLETRDKISQRNLCNSNTSKRLISPENFNPNLQIVTNKNINQKVTSSEDYHDDKLKIFSESRSTIDKLLSYYCPLLEEHNQNLRNSVNALISAINTKQLPNVLISLSKLVIIAGQQMISIGDTINRNVSGEMSCYIAKCSNSLCQSLKNLITNTKTAASLYPSSSALQDLLDSIVQVSIHSDQLTLLKEQNFLN
ncbi:probable myosin light chain kinase DDB_G0279831 [Panonychus citri]|uniref:probable myosin light chain kinase DDB_G0279831 n=1 Tax=Panonychus citri TaxID=50023 RepID=UPI002308178D|nr:probable myosin light chain kinase DDB_G0279831 [Panonychus citri]